MRPIFEAIIALSVMVTVVLFFLANRVDHQRRIKAWNGVPFDKSQYSASKKQSRLLRTTCVALLGVAAVAAYCFFVLP